VIQGVEACRCLDDPLGRVEDLSTRPDGLVVGRLRVPLGLIGFICEARPGAVVEAAALAVKSGNGLMAKPGRESSRTSGVLGDILAAALAMAGLPRSAVRVLPDLDAEQLRFMISQDGILDLVIPRGGADLISFVDENSRVPVLRHFQGVNHLYVDERADVGMAVSLAVNGKCDRPSTCNALECLLVHRARLDDFLPQVCDALARRDVTIYACPEARARVSGLEEALEHHYGHEFMGLALALRVVPDMDVAMAHIRLHGSRHTESICTSDLATARRFLSLVDAGCVLANASTRLNDGGCLGLGAEIGISTSKVHAYGPMGLRELTTTKFVVLGHGHLRS
jgi:glutamate-5-semialdehyde dehydrogenase